MKQVKFIIFRYLTDADFFNMYKPSRTESGGGGQLYIDFLTRHVPVGVWDEFFEGVTGLQIAPVRNGSRWTFPVHSLGSQQLQQLSIYKRREASICIPNQNINTRSANRVYAWLPDNGFPEPDNPEDRHSVPFGLAVYLVRTYDNEIWAGWFQNNSSTPSPCQNVAATQLLSEIINVNSEAGDVGYVNFNRGEIIINEIEAIAPFVSGVPVEKKVDRKKVEIRTAPRQARPQRRLRTEAEIVESLFSEDEDCTTPVNKEAKVRIQKIQNRNSKAVKGLKELYAHKCQITGEEYTFKKRDGVPYTEAHHLEPLSSGGADNPLNMIIINPLIHKMLHYAKVEGVDFSAIKTDRDKSAFLNIKINNKCYTIRWHPEHAARILAFMDSSSS
jgi:5-methylcytosine-specific restriction protein A